MSAKGNKTRMKKLIQRDGTKCHYCGCETLVDVLMTNPTKERTIDHIRSKSQGGTDHIDNLVIACRSCNSSKGTRDYGTIIFKRDSDNTILFLMGR